MGHALNKRERLDELEALLQFAPEDGLTCNELATQLDCDPATITRDLKEIEQDRTLIKVSYGHYRLDPTESLSNVRLHPSEALSIYLALRRFIRQTSAAPGFMLTALKKVAPAVRQPELVNTLAQAIREMEAERQMAANDAGVWGIILRAWIEKLVVRIHYVNAKDPTPRIHEIEPLHFEPAILSDGTYLIAWSLTRNALRTFKLDRIKRATLTNLRCTPRPQIDIHVLLRHSWGIWYGEETHRVELRFSPEVAARVMESIWHPREQKQALEDGSVLWSVEIAGTLEIKSWVRGWGPDVEVLAPPALRDEVARDMRAAARLYGDGEEGN
jgi:predicted DNA-binding transcriptional regulator YafY